MKGVRAMSARTMHEEWETPARIFDPLNAEFGFTLDAAALPHNAKCARYFVPSAACPYCRSAMYAAGDAPERLCAVCNGLAQSWYGETVWLNPPYGYLNLDRWMQKAFTESQRGCAVVCLVPAHTGQPWWHRWVVGKAEIRWIRGKVKFVGADSCAPFPSCVVIYRPETADFEAVA